MKKIMKTNNCSMNNKLVPTHGCECRYFSFGESTGYVGGRKTVCNVTVSNYCFG